MSLRYLVNKVACFLRNCRGFTLLEVVIALSIGSLIVAASTQILTQVYTVVPKTQSSILAMRQVQVAGHWISRDATMAQGISITDNNTYNLSTTPLVFTHVNWASDNTTTLTYSVDTTTDPANYKLNRHVVVKDKNGNVLSDTQMQVADSIASISAQYIEPVGQDDKVLTVTITARVQSSSKTKVYEISPRSL